MKLKMLFTIVAIAAVLLAFFGLAACKEGAGKKANPDVDYYTCTMHPSVKSQDPDGKCPICSMDLVPVMKKGAAGAAGPEHHHHDVGPAAVEMKTMEGKSPADNGLSEFSVPVERQQQIGVTYAVAALQPLRHAIRSVGFIVPDRSKRWEFVARVEGYVQQLNITSPGELVDEGTPLLTIYSPDLLTSSRELVNLLDSRDHAGSPAMRDSAQRLVDAARFRLQQWNVTDQQIAELERSRKPTEYLTLRSPFRGVVEDVPVEQGRKVMIGDHLVNVADLSVVWLWAEFYEDELPMLKKGQQVTVTSDSYPGEKFEGEVGLVNPFLSEQLRTGKVRVDIPNADLKLRPGMYVNIELAIDMGEGLAIPVNAVMPTGLRNLVFVDQGEGKLEPRLVQLGRKFGENYQVLSGLKSGERVVASANFLIDAESKVQGAVKSFEEPDQAPAAAVEEKPAPLPGSAGTLYGPMLKAYLGVHQALAADRFEDVSAQAKNLRERIAVLAKSNLKPATLDEKYRQKVDALNATGEKFTPANLDQARIEFGELSASLIALLQQFSPPLERPLEIVKCPMWDKSPARWLQVGDTIENPFLGQQMPACGEKAGVVKSSR